MALRVPTYDSLQVGATVAQPGRIDGSFANNVGQEAMQTGQALTQASNVASRVAIDMQQQANQLRIDDGLNQVEEEALRLTYDKSNGFANQKGEAAINRQSGKMLSDEYGEMLGEHISRVSASLGNDAQRQAFAKHSRDILTAFKGRAIRHEAEEFKTYELSKSEGIQATALRDIGLNWRDPDATASAIQRIEAETFRQANALGKSAEWQKAQARRMTSNGHKIAMLAALEENDPSFADQYLKRFSANMEADDILAVRAHITKEMDNRVGMGVAGEVMRKIQPRINPSGFDRLVNITMATESGGQRYGRDGQLLTSPKGAKGEMQVMDATNLNPGYGVTPAKDNSPEERARVGREYLGAMLKEYGGDVGMAWAAYNAGPGRLNEAIKKAERNNKLAKNDPAIGEKTYLDFLPKETQDYVAKNTKALEGGEGQGRRPTFAEIDDQLRSDPRLASNPARYKTAREEASRLFTEQEKAIKQRDEESVAFAMREIVKNGGRWTDLPASVRGAVPPKEVDNLIGFAQKISKGDDSTSLWLYNKLAANPDSLAKMSDDQFFALRRELSEADFKHFSNERAKRAGALPGSNGPGDLNSGAIKTVIDDHLRMFKLDPTPKDGSNDAARVGAIRKFVNDHMLAAQLEAGKKFTDAEVSQQIGALFAKNMEFRGFFSNSSGPMLTAKAGDIPSSEKDQIKAAFKRQGIDNPTDAQILDIFWKRKSLAQK